ncbi:hypothetical protein BDQ17DRAFT_1342135 [Cyathus striatus]|nr:hypothetical protein BDQ17DRAFT_1342135 [Cyathus striatus]
MGVYAELKARLRLTLSLLSVHCTFTYFDISFSYDSLYFTLITYSFPCIGLLLVRGACDRCRSRDLL